MDNAQLNTPQNTVYIYGLFDPRNLQLRYIGKTINDLNRRLKRHLYEATAKSVNYNQHKDNWIKQLLNENLEPAIEILEECTEDNWSECEIAWIKECREKGLNLTNISNGGENPPNRKGKPLSEKHKKRISESHMGDKNPMWGKRISKESRKKQSDALKGKPRPDGMMEKLAEFNKGRKFSEKHKENLKKAWIKRKEKYGNSGFRAESIKKMRQSHLDRWEKIRNENRVV